VPRASLSQDSSPVSASIRQRRGLPRVPGRVSLVRGLQVPPMHARSRLRAGGTKTLAVRHQVSLTSGTILHHTKTPLTLWFWAAYLMTTDKRGVSALLLQRQLGLQRYETAWMILTSSGARR